MRRVLVTALLGSFLAAGVARADDGGEDVLAPLPWHADADTVFLRRIVEAATGTPVAGARVRLFCEVPHPEPGFGTPAATATSGPGGWARIAKKDVDRTIAAVYGEPTWAYVEADGLRPDAAYAGERIGETWELGPSTTLCVKLLDPLDRPVEGALVGWFLGCGHTPDVRQAVTGADGVATIERAGHRGYGQLWPVKAGLRSRYVTDDAWAPWERPRVARLEWAGVVEGVVLGADGEPAAGVGVGAPEVHRGPWTRTDARGEFRLVGASPTAGLVVEAGEYPVGPAGAPFPPLAIEPLPPLRRRVVRLPLPTEPTEERPSVRLVVEVRRTGWPKTEEVPPVHVVAVRASDGFAVEGAVGKQGVALLDVRPGRHAVHGFGRRELRDGITYSSGRADVDVPSTGGAYARIDLPAPRVLVLDVPRLPDVALELVAEGESELLPHDGDGGLVPVLLPSDRAVFLRVSQARPSSGGHVVRTRLVPLDREEEPGRFPAVLDVPVFRPVEVTARLVDEAGEPVPGRLAELGETREDGPASAAPTLSTLAGENVVLAVEPEDRGRHRSEILEVPSLASAQGPVDLGVVRLVRRPGSLRVLGPDGSPSAGARILVTRDDRAEELTTDGSGIVEEPEEGPGPAATGAVVRFLGPGSVTHPASEHRVPFARRLEGPAPWTVRTPGGSLTIALPSGAPEEERRLVVHLDGRRFEAEGPVLLLLGIEAGPHEAVIEVSGRRARRLRFTLAEGEQRRWTPELTAAPGPR